MKLVNKKSSNQGDGKCRATTQGGSRCSRTAVQHGYCHQHYRLLKEKGVVVDSKGDEPLEEVPAIPEGIQLEALGKRQWQYYCRYLIDRGGLYQIYLSGLATLCNQEEQLEQAKKDISEFGAVNVTDSGWMQRNGYASHFDSTLQNIRNLRKDYGLTLESGKSGDSSNSDSKDDKPTYSNKKTKNW